VEWGLKHKLDIEVVKINTNCEGIGVNVKYTVDSSAACWKGLYEAWQSTGKTQADWVDRVLAFKWMLTAKKNSAGKIPYQLKPVEHEDGRFEQETL